ncbi:MAG: NUDIX hydrolase [Bacteroides sp.]|nr:NUDIX hydrolase [Roseburia sp.]MCM1346803.1 NUDIX hydrolase [Bacteroides sp.]MCM1420266.1 NUDIX hydrolase [Bacteroides sp.]
MSEKNIQSVNPYVSVDCVLLGFDGKQLNVLLVRQCESGGVHSTDHYKLPGSLIYMDEDLDDAAQRVLKQLTGLTQVKMVQFRAFGGAQRLSNPNDTIWLERFHHLEHHLERIVTIAYLSLLRIERRYKLLNDNYEACWIPVNKVPQLAFDHNEIVKEAILSVRNIATINPSKLFDLLPRKFTAAQLYSVYTEVTGKKIDFRNFHKKMQSMPYVIQLEEKEQGVSHRAAHYYRFDKKLS